MVSTNTSISLVVGIVVSYILIVQVLFLSHRHFQLSNSIIIISEMDQRVNKYIYAVFICMIIIYRWLVWHRYSNVCRLIQVDAIFDQYQMVIVSISKWIITAALIKSETTANSNVFIAYYAKIKRVLSFLSYVLLMCTWWYFATAWMDGRDGRVSIAQPKLT